MHISSTKRMPALTKNEIEPTTGGKRSGATWPDSAHGVEHADRGGQRVGDLLHRRGAGLLQVVAADVDRVPRRRVVGAPRHHVDDQPAARLGREDVRAPGQVLLHDVVLRRAAQLGRRHALLLGVGDVEAEQPRRGGVDRHRRVHAAGRDAVEQRPHVAEVGDRHAGLADLAARLGGVGVVAGLGGQVEGDRQPGLTLGQVGAVQRVRGGRRRVARVRPHQPGFSHRRIVSVAPGPRHRAHWRRCGTSSSLVLAYLLGSVPFSNIFAVRLRRVDLRTTGSGTVSGTGPVPRGRLHPAGGGRRARRGQGRRSPSCWPGPSRPVVAALAGDGRRDRSQLVAVPARLGRSRLGARHGGAARAGVARRRRAAPRARPRPHPRGVRARFVHRAGVGRPGARGHRRGRAGPRRCVRRDADPREAGGRQRARARLERARSIGSSTTTTVPRPNDRWRSSPTRPPRSRRPSPSRTTSPWCRCGSISTVARSATARVDARAVLAADRVTTSGPDAGRVRRRLSAVRWSAPTPPSS